jgi:GH15 family glucan-1,4-alpha-glucosidase
MRGFGISGRDASNDTDIRVAIDRGLRLAEKRNLPCPNRVKWFETRDKLYEEIQTKGWK